MKVLQAIHSYKPYLPHFEEKYKIDKENISFLELKELLLKDRFYASHLLQPVLNDELAGFYTMWDYPLLQHKWAEEKGWNEKDVKKILYAQIEDFKPDVFYNCSPIRFSKEEIENNISTDISKICWYASPETKQIDFSVYGTRLTNLPSDVKSLDKVGFRNDLFQPAHDPVMDEVRAKAVKDTDIFFYGQYLKAFFKTRNALIDSLLEYKVSSNYKIDVALQYSMRKKQNYPFSRPYRFRTVFGEKVVEPSKLVITNSIKPLYGLDLYEKIAASKIVFNAAVDFSGNYKVNMRNFEALGLGAHMLSDKGLYPDHFDAGVHFSTYNNFEGFVKKAEYLLANDEQRSSISNAGNSMIRTNYSKEQQWQRFQEIIASL
jgi:hypothetical protein